MTVVSTGRIAQQINEGRLYEIVYERRFDEQMAQIMGSMERGDEFMRHIEWVLARGVERGCLIAENMRRLEVRDGGVGLVRIDYVRDEATRRIHLVSITR